MNVILYIAISANGYIAKLDDDVDWVSSSQWQDYEKAVRRTKAVIVGRRTYELMSEEEFFDGCLYVVVTKNNSIFTDKENVVFTAQSPKGILEDLEKKGYKEVCLVGGGKTNTSFMKDGLVDEIYLDVEPIVFGKGIQLFSPDEFEASLQLLEVKKLGEQTVQIHYKVKK